MSDEGPAAVQDASQTHVGACRNHPEDRAYLVCARCGDNQCGQCAAWMRAGFCSACADRVEDHLAVGGRKLVLACSGLQAGGLVWLSYETVAGQTPAPQVVSALALAFLVCSGLCAALYRGHELARSSLLTLSGLGGVVGLIVGQPVTSMVSLAMAGMLLTRSVSAYVTVQARTRRLAQGVPPGR